MSTIRFQHIAGFPGVGTKKNRAALFISKSLREVAWPFNALIRSYPQIILVLFRVSRPERMEDICDEFNEFCSVGR